jgi:phosphopantothenoylcysteine decarboxylase/phosphopantothenate--cysteine ligase
MNVRMWHHPATQENLARVIARGTRTVGPVEGSMACGEYGIGRLAEPPDIVEAVITALTSGKPLAGRRALVTAGPTLEAIDPIRFISNRSSGKQGYAIAAALAEAGAATTLVSGPTSIPAPAGVNTVRVEAATDMMAACNSALPADIAVFTAAVADWRVDSTSSEKIKKQDGAGPPQLHLVENPDILRTIATLPKGRPSLVIGFAAETQDVIAHARTKLARKACDWIVANDVAPATGVLGGDENTVHVVCAAGEETWPKLAKQEVARRLVDRMVRHFGKGEP